MEVNLLIYLDANATAPLTPEVSSDLKSFIDGLHGNPSSAHALGNAARRAISRSREALAELVGALPGDVFFTSGATEANNWVLRSAVACGNHTEILTTQVEHPSIASTLDSLSDEDHSVRYLALDRGGQVDLNQFEQALSPAVRLVSIQWVNSETGIIQPIEALSAICQEYSTRLHVDAAQAAGRLKIDLSALPIDFLSVSGHKFHSPAGVGALILRDHTFLQPLLYGGAQEQGMRSGTENLLGIAGIGSAARNRMNHFEQVTRHLRLLTARFEEALLAAVPDAEIVGAQSPRIGNTSSVRFPGVDGQALVAQLSERGLMCSQGSACHNNRPEPSLVMRALGYSEREAYECVRFSFSELNDAAEIAPAVEMITSCVERLRLFA